MSDEEKDLIAQGTCSIHGSVPDVIKQFFSKVGKKGGLASGDCKKRGGKRYYKKIQALSVAARKRNAAARKAAQ